ncbi:hypothetical protein [Salinactinospora qingdaonensis]
MANPTVPELSQLLDELADALHPPIAAPEGEAERDRVVALRAIGISQLVRDAAHTPPERLRGHLAAIVARNPVTYRVWDDATTGGGE